MFLGGSTGSTAGGIKMVRHLILLKNMKSLFTKQFHSNALLSIKINKRHLPERINESALSFIALYFSIFAIGSLSLSFLGINIETASSSVATCMAGIGPGIGSVGPVGNFAHLPVAAKIILSCAMILGRLEIYTVLILFTRGFWSKGNV
jgi:trk system potassium uptake protein TrkH